jgi:predicted small integral membrane protein
MRILALFGSFRMVLVVLTAITALYMGLVAFGNISDYGTNQAFVQHVLAMDTTFPSSNTKWRAITDRRLVTAVCIAIISWESLTALVLAIAFFGWLRGTAGKRASVVACQLSICGWLMQVLLFGGGFIIVGGEWFQMWQSAQWNGMQAAFRNLLLPAVGLVLAGRCADILVSGVEA